jgi:hypothetical protein
VHFSLLFALRDTVKDEITLLDFPRSHLLVAPPSGFLLVFAEVDCRLGFDSFDCVNCWLDVLVRCFCPIRPGEALLESWPLRHRGA